MANHTQPKTLSSLPFELLLTISSFLHDIEDFTSLTSTSRLFHSLRDTTSPLNIFRLAAASSRVFFRPSPHFLIAAVSRQLGDWARSSPANALRLKLTFQGGVDELLDLCLDPLTGCGLTMEDIRALHAMRFSTLNPVTDLIDKCIGTQWYSTPNFWYGGVDDAYTLNADPDEAIFHLAIYGGIFAGDFDVLLSSEAGDGTGSRGKVMLGEDTRLEYVKYCMPDWSCQACQRSARDVGNLNDGTIDPRRFVQEVKGPYAGTGNNDLSHNHQVSLLWLLTGKRFTSQWVAVLEGKAGIRGFDEEGWTELRYSRRWNSPGDGVEPSWKQELWEAAVMFQGLESLEMLGCAKARWKGPDRTEVTVEDEFGQSENRSVETDRGEAQVDMPDQKWLGRLLELKQKIGTLTQKPDMITVGRQKTWRYPSLKGDLEICTSGYVAGT